jgi:ABC-type multidrug transport system fused ATPase/permease subunit
MRNSFAQFLTTIRRFGVSWRMVAVLMGLQLLSIASEAAGIATLLPVFERLQHGTEAFQGPHWSVLRTASDRLGIPLSLGVLLSISFVFLLIRQLVRYLSILAEGVQTKQVVDRVRRRVFLGFLRVKSAVQQEIRSGELVAELTAELSRAVKALFSIFDLVTTVIQMVVYMTGLFLLSVPMAAISMVIVVAAGICIRHLAPEIKRTSRALTAAGVQAGGFLAERLQRARLIRLSGTEKAEAAAFTAISRRQMSESLRQKLVGARMTLMPEPIAIGAAYIILFFGATIFGIGLEKLALFLLLLTRLLPVVRAAIVNYNGIVGLWGSVERVESRLHTFSEAPEERGGDKIFDRLDHGIDYEHVFFSYGSSGAPALRDVTVRLPAQHMTGLIGPSGAGKSTFVDLLPRLRDPSAGEIRFDGVPITDFSMTSLRLGIAYVPQQPQIFDITAAEHIRYGKQGATDAEVREAARLSGALPFIEALPNGFDTPLGDGGARLSGGQRQRLDIARALVRRAPILILDEPTSALDIEAEFAFRDALRTLRAETRLTIIVIAHRLSTIADADQIIVLRRGCVEAAGTHDEVLTASEWYAESLAKHRVLSGGAAQPALQQAASRAEP